MVELSNGDVDMNREQFFEQYKLMTGSAIKLVEWRNAANNYFLTATTLLVTMFGLAASFQGTAYWQRSVAIAGAVICLVWLLLIQSYRRLNSSKFAVIHEMEQSLPFAPFGREWEIHKAKPLHRTLSSVESLVPGLFFFLFVALGSVTFSGPTNDESRRIRIDTIAAPVEVNHK